MYLLSLETADPQSHYTQQDCFDIFNRSTARKRMKSRSVGLMEKVLLRNNGISTRRFCYPEVETIFDADPQKLNNVFEATAPQLGGEALYRAICAASVGADDIDSLIVCTCTGYLCPGLSSFIAEQAGLREDCELVDLVGMGCGAAIPSLRLASHQVQAYPDRRVAVVAVEICSAAFYLDDDPGVIISACLFGDGAAASIWTGARPARPGLCAGQFDSVHLPEDRQLLRFENANGYLRNRLSRKVPEQAAHAVSKLFDRAVARGMNPETTTVLPHTGGRDVLDALETGFPGVRFPESRLVLDQHGNMSSPSILYVLREYMNKPHPKENNLWLCSFGAGFSAHGFQLNPAT